VSAREDALAIWAKALAAGDVAPLVRAHLRLEGSRLTAGALAVDLDRTRRVIVLGCGKASGAMAVALESSLGDRITEGLVVVKDGYLAPTRHIRLLEAGHPVPDARGQAAALTLLERARDAGPDDLVICLISGGGSALTPAPAPPITLEEKQVVTRLLLAAGATIGELNAVRKHLSLVKGGQLARAVAPARLLVLALSDVIGDPLDVIASGMTAPDPTTFADAIRVITQRGVGDRVPGSVRARLEAGRRGEIEETPKAGDPIFMRVTNLVIGNNALIVDAAAAAANALGYRPHVLTRDVQGEARDVGRDLVTRGRLLVPPAALIAGGETTVTVVGEGRGGRCQEVALAAALAIRASDEMTMMAAGTDGTDGPTDAAGAIVDSGTVARAQAVGLDAECALARNDSYALLAASEDLLRSGPTNTNLLDLYVVLHGASRGGHDPSGAHRIGEVG
jgi:hydroxypyruvate reductase